MSNSSADYRFQCPECNRSTSGIADMPTFTHIDSLSGRSFAAADGSITCMNCAANFNVKLRNCPTHCSINLIDHPGTVVRTWDVDTSYFHRQIADDPTYVMQVFSENYTALTEIVLGIIQAKEERGYLTDSEYALERMAYANAIAMFEAFLSDTILVAVLRNKIVLSRLIAKDQELEKRTLSLRQVLEDPQIVKETVFDYLANIIYHKLERVQQIYGFALRISIFPSKEVRRNLDSAIKNRHVIVHRNGRHPDGSSIPCSARDTLTLLNDIQSIVAHIYGQLNHAVTELKRERDQELDNRTQRG